MNKQDRRRDVPQRCQHAGCWLRALRLRLYCAVHLAKVQQGHRGEERGRGHD